MSNSPLYTVVNQHGTAEIKPACQRADSAAQHCINADPAGASTASTQNSTLGACPSRIPRERRTLSEQQPHGEPSTDGCSDLITSTRHGPH